MKFISIFKLDPAQVAQEPPNPQMYADMGALIAELMGTGKMLDTGGVEPTGLQARVKKSNGQFVVTDGPFAESKEIVGGFALFNVDSKDEAIGYTRRFLDIVGSGTCELIEVAETPRPSA